MWCRFGASAPVEAHVHSTGAAECVTPAGLVPGEVSLEVSTNGVDFSASATQFGFFTPPVALSLTPANGPEAGGTAIVLRGAHLFAATLLRCKFGEVHVDAVFVTSTMANCSAPKHEPGLVSVEVSTNGVDFSASGLNFLYAKAPKLTNLHPRTLSGCGGDGGVYVAGASSDRTEAYIVVIALNLMPGTMCIIGNATSSYSSLISANELLCTVPVDVLGTGDHALKLTSNLQDLVDTGDAVSVGECIRVSSVSPLFGPVAGGTPLVVSGDNFVKGDDWSCRFGGSTDASVIATWQQGGTLRCIAPPLPVGDANVEVSNNNQQYSTSGVLFSYLETPVVNRAVPAHVHAHPARRPHRPQALKCGIRSQVNRRQDDSTPK